MRQIDRAESLGQIPLLDHLNPCQMALPEWSNRNGKGRDSILAPLSGVHSDRFHLKIDVLHSQPKDFHDEQSTSLKHFDDKLRRSI